MASGYAWSPAAVENMSADDIDWHVNRLAAARREEAASLEKAREKKG